MIPTNMKKLSIKVSMFYIIFMRIIGVFNDVGGFLLRKHSFMDVSITKLVKLVPACRILSLSHLIFVTHQQEQHVI